MNDEFPVSQSFLSPHECDFLNQKGVKQDSIIAIFYTVVASEPKCVVHLNWPLLTPSDGANVKGLRYCYRTDYCILSI